MEMYEKLELIAKCLREGREVQVLDPNGWTKKNIPEGNVSVFASSEYRAAPEKPRAGTVVFAAWPAHEEKPLPFCAVELTDSVRSALEDAGIDYDTD